MDKVKETIKELLQKMNVSFEDVEVSLSEYGENLLTIKTAEENSLIGPQGEHFLALTHLVKKITAKILGDEIQISFDVNNYQARNKEKLKEKALILAERARSFKTSVAMDPMSSYERMLIHSLFALSPDIKTESQGFGPKRHVVIRYKESAF